MNQEHSPHASAGQHSVTRDAASQESHGTLIDAWLHHATTDPDRDAIYTESTGWVSHGTLNRDSTRVAMHFTASGLVPGERVLFSSSSSYALVVAHVAALRSGLVVVPANTAYRRDELAHIASDSDIVAAVIDDVERAGWLQAAAPSIRTFTPQDLLAAEAPSPDSPSSPRPEDLALICYTSGTTGRPKGAALSHANALASSTAVAQEWEWTRSDRLILCLPLFHAHGLAVGVHGVLLTGGSMIMQGRFSAPDVLSAIDQHGATMFFGVPTMYERLLAADDVELLARLRLCVSGSAPLSAATWEELRDRTGQEVLERYGMSETLMLTSNPGRGERRPGTVGRSLPGVEVRLASDEGTVGGIEVRGPSVFSGYWRNEEATTEAFTSDGWFRTGDLGEFDDAGYLKIVGRDKDLIITGGYNVYPREIEDVLRDHPAVEDAAVVGRPSREWGETVTAFLVLAEGAELDPAGLQLFAKERLARYKVPRTWEVIEALPRNAMGKVVKAQLPA